MAMKAIIADTLSSLESYELREIPRPSPDSTQILVRVASCGVGYVDSLVALGRYQVKPPTPFIPGREIAGIVEAAGEAVKTFRPGDRVFALAQSGFAEYALASETTTYRMPDDMPFDEAASFPLNYLTAFHGLVDRGALSSGETVLVFGAAGGVGSAATQIAKALGARVVAAASSEEKRTFAKQMGADHVIDTFQEGWRDRLKSLLSGAKPDVIFDPVCGPLFEAAFRSLNWRGRHLVVGFVGGPIPALPINLTLMKGASLLGVDVRQYMEFEGHQLNADFRQLGALYRQGQIRPVPGMAFDFPEFGAALNSAFSGQNLGKVVLKIDRTL